MKASFKKLKNEICCELSEIKNEDFTYNNEFYCYDNEFSDSEFNISFRIKIAENIFIKTTKIYSAKKHTYLEKNKNGFTICFRVPRGKYSEKKDSKSRFYFYQEQSVKLIYSFKMQEVKETAFDYEVIENTGKKTNNINKRKRNNNKKILKNQKWILEHPFQGGSFSPR